MIRWQGTRLTYWPPAELSQPSSKTGKHYNTDTLIDTQACTHKGTHTLIDTSTHSENTQTHTL